MGKPVKTHIKRIEVALNKSKKKFVSLADLSKMVGVYQDALGEELSYFCPLIRIDYSINCRDLLPDLKKFLLEKQEPAKKKREYHRKDAVRVEELRQYSSTMDYIYKRLTSVSGLIDPSTALSDHDLRLLAKLIVKDRKKLRANKKAKEKQAAK